jgi:hypothetical protein
MRLGVTPRRCPTNPLGKTIPATIQHCAERPVSAPSHCAAYFCTANTSSPQRGGRWNPRMGANAFSMTTQDYTVTSGQRERSSPSLSALCGHPRHRNTTPGTMTTSQTLLKRARMGRRHAHHCASYGLPFTAPSSRPAGGGRTADLYATTLEAAPVRAQDSSRRPNRSEIRQDGRQLRGTARHAFTRRRIVWHTCKLHPP